MGVVETEYGLEEHVDPAYPTTSPPDAVYPCQTREPFGSPLDGVATPQTASRLLIPLERSLRELWDSLGLLARHQTDRWVTLHYGRLALNAHAWERLRSKLVGDEPDATLIAPREGGWKELPETFEDWRVRLRRSRFLTRLEQAEETGEERLIAATESEWRDLPTAELSRGLLDVRTWTELLMPYLGLRLLCEDPFRADARVRSAIAFEQRSSAEVGRRLASEGVLYNPSDVAYLTVEERTRAVHEASPFWMKVVTVRQRRVDSFVDLDVPLRFWGQPRVEREKDDG